MTAASTQGIDLLTFAEQATLGGLLLTPSAVPVVARWLRPSDFIDPWHREVYSTVLGRYPRPISAVDTGRDLVKRLGGRRADLPRVHALIAITPDRPQPIRYGQMVLESGIRQQTQALGVLLRAGARLAGSTGSPRLLTDAAHVVTAVLAADLTRWNLATNADMKSEGRMEPARLAELAPVVIPDWRPLALGADRALRAHPAPDPAAVRQRERDLIAALITHPQAVAQAAWLRPEMLTDRSWRTAYVALLQLSERGVPIDALTLAWEIHRASPQHGPGPGVGDLQRGIEAARSVDPRFTAIGVAADTVDRLAGHTIASIRAASTNPGIDVRDVIDTARLMTATLNDLAAVAPYSTKTPRPTALRPAADQSLGRRDRSPSSTGPGSGRLRIVH